MIRFRECFLVRIKPNQVAVEDLLTGKVEKSDSHLKFGNDRLLITDTKEPETTLKELIKKLTYTTLVSFSRTIIINPYHPNIAQFTEVEKRTFRDLAGHLGARKTYLVFNKDVSGRQLDSRFLKYQAEV